MMVEKVSTGVNGLDKILKGGYLKNKPTLIKGGPGSGKTNFTLFFTHAQLKAGNQVIYVTCDEQPEQIINYMDSFGLQGSQYQREGKLLVLDFTPEFTDEMIGEFSLDALLLRIEHAKEKINASTLIIDSLQGMLLGLVNHKPEIDLLSLFSWAQHEKLTTLCTVAGELNISQTALYEEYLVDCAIELSQQLKNNLMTRYLRVIKFRGSGHGTNQYPFSIIKNGISLLPITESRLINFATKKYLSTGIQDLDKMLGGKGYQIGSTLMFSGRSGTGKTIFVATLAKTALLKKKKVLYVSFEESPNDLINHLQSVGLNLIPFIKEEKLHINSRRSIEMGLEDHIISVMDIADSGKFDFIILDPISSLLDVGTLMDLKIMFIRFITNMKISNRTLVFTELLPDNNQDITNLGISSMTDTWIRLRQMESNGEFNRILYISKSRGTKTSNQLKEFLITNTGICIEEPYTGQGEMVFGSRKAEMLSKEQESNSERIEEMARIDSELKALEEDLTAQIIIRKTEFNSKKNSLLRKKQALVNQKKQANKQVEVNKLRRK